MSKVKIILIFKSLDLDSGHDVFKEFAVDLLAKTFLGVLAPVDVQVVHDELDRATLKKKYNYFDEKKIGTTITTTITSTRYASSPH